MDKTTENKSTNTEMSFFDHLGELRKRILLMLAGIIVGCAVSGVFINFIMNNLLLKPATNVQLKLQNLKPFGQPFLYFKTIFICGIIIATPFILYQLWKFIAPALYENERKWVSKITFFTSLCFFCGIVFSYFVLIPSMLNFAASFGTESVSNIIDINEYFGFISMILLAAGIMFEMPMIAFILAKFGIVRAKILSKYRRHAIITILILAAVLTPTPDPVSQLIFASPLFILYEISILIAKSAEKKVPKTEEK